MEPVSPGSPLVDDAYGWLELLTIPNTDSQAICLSSPCLGSLSVSVEGSVVVTLSTSQPTFIFQRCVGATDCDSCTSWNNLNLIYGLPREVMCTTDLTFTDSVKAAQGMWTNPLVNKFINKLVNSNP